MIDVWHKCVTPIIPRRTVDSTWTGWTGQTWCRRVDGHWQYKQDVETEQEFLERTI